MAAEPTRRGVIAAVAAGSLGLTGLTGCKGIAALGPVPAISPDVAALERAIAAEQLLIDRYQAATGQLSGAGAGAGAGRLAVLGAIRAEHEAHLAQLREHLVVPARLAGKKSHVAAPPLPGGASASIDALIADERAAVARLTGELLDAPPVLAQLLASIAAAEAVHAVLLRRVGSGAKR